MSQYCVSNPISKQFEANWGNNIYSTRRDGQTSGEKMGPYSTNYYGNYGSYLRAPATCRSGSCGNSYSAAPSTNYVSANNFWNNKN